MSRRLLIAPDWLGLSGLWTLDGKGRRQPVDAEEIGLSDELADRVEAWMDSFDAIYDEDEPARSRFADENARLAFEAEGLALAHAAAAELGAGWDVSTDFARWRTEPSS